MKVNESPQHPSIKSRIPDLIVSVESRKGGVGKTTAALCLSRLLRSRGYAVLFLDLDFTGTNAADIADSPFWLNDVSVIQNGMTGEAHNKTCNLLQMFDQCYMSGELIPRFSIQNSSSKNSIQCDLNKINIIGSQIYRTEKEHNGKLMHTDSCIMQPSDLFDKLHSYWLLDFVKQLIEDFVMMARRDKQKIAIVLDNSPGYIGIAPAIHDWLTDLGPIIAKLLFVSSLDKQDILSCNFAIDAVHRLFTRKWNTSRQYMEASKPLGTIDDVEDEEFFLRLANTNHDEGTSSLAFYQIDNANYDNQKDLLSLNITDKSEKYLALVFNRVPRAIKKGDIDFELLYLSDRDFSPIISLMKHEDRFPELKSRMVSYDEYIENQFLYQSMQRKYRSSRYLTNWRRLIEKIDQMEETFIMPLPNTEKDIYENFTIHSPYFQRIGKRIFQANAIITEARSNMAETGLSHLARLIHDEWLPGSIVPTFRVTLLTLLRDSRLPFMDMSPFELEDRFDTNEINHISERLYERLVHGVHELTNNGLIIDELSLEILIGVLSFLVASSLSPRIWHSSIEKELSEFLTGVLSIELTHWSSDSEGLKRKRNLQEFLARESVTKRELRNDKMFRLGSMRFMRNSMMHGEDTFIEFYRSCTSAQARLIDFEADSRFVLQLIRFMVEQNLGKEENDNGNLFPFVRGIAEKVIIEKTLTHREARNRMSHALKTAEYFSEFKAVLSSIFNDWEIGK
ncbi:hypothetical protein MASR1M36_07080 [Candidatus Cloacimonadaceae bacterium]